MEQPTFAKLDHDMKKHRTCREMFLERMDKLAPMERLKERVEPFYPKPRRGRRPHPVAGDAARSLRPTLL